MDFRNSVDILANPDWHAKLKMPISLKAGELLAHLVAGNKLTAEIMSFKHAAVTELVSKGVIQLNLSKRDKKTGTTPGKIIRFKVIALADEAIAAMEEWRHTQ